MLNPNNIREFFKEFLAFWNQPLQKHLRFIFNVSFSVIKNLLFILLCGFILLGIFGTGIGLGYFASLTANEKPLTQEEMSDAITNLNLVSSFYYQNGEKISDVTSDEVRLVTTLDNISPFVKDGIVATEDSYFYQHNGIVPKALVRALLQEAVSSNAGVSGGSTLTQQLIKQQILTSEVTFKRKANEILYALRLEKYFSKEQILEAYLNVSPFGRNHNGLNISGIEEAAQGVFGVSAKDLTLPQAAYLVGMPQNPISYTPYTNYATLKEDVSAGLTRMKTVLFSMYREKKITKQQYEDALAYNITQDFLAPEEISTQRQSYLYQAVNREATKILMKKMAEKDHLTYDQLKKDTELFNRYYDRANGELATGGYKITSTIDKGIYEAMQDSTAANGSKIGPTYQTPYIDQNTGESKKQTDMAQNGAVLIENKTGRILGFVAGRDFQVNQVDHAFTTHRSPGSTIKPLLVYAPAMENNIIYPASIIPDTKISILQQNGTYWEPTNYGNKISNNFLTARHSLEFSLNNPTIKIFQTMLSKGINAGEYLKKMGIKGIGEEEYQNIALSIGGTKTGPTVMEQTSAFSTLANGGVHHEAYLIEKIEDIHGKAVYQHEDVTSEVFSPATAYLTTDILRKVASATYFYNIKANLNFNADIAGKTGTSEFEVDNWFVGYTPEVTLGSWIGYDNFYSARYSITEADGYGHPTMRSLRNWTLLMNAVYNAKPNLFNQNAKFDQPSSVYQDSVVSATGTKSGTATYNGKSYFINGNTTTDLFKKDFGPIDPTYHFAIGATNNELDRYWNGLSVEELEKKKAKQEEDKKKLTSEEQKPTSSTQTTKSRN
ncbi:transglycosylase domain-containing protein [uncultured Granulicatella sp.]|uniref:transglycosylase domain-containing protein n=1 Tax=uncultured Granulicatella sp. TaxID=316089 RepID=UPI0028D2C1CC|nr:transglycosylase domain-containing protein [uncultured Granulicatella sp.]